MAKQTTTNKQPVFTELKNTFRFFPFKNQTAPFIVIILLGLIFNFIFKYQEVQVRTFRKLGLNAIGENINAIHFYDNLEFQSWAIRNYKKNGTQTIHGLYKRDYKQYIFDCNGDEDYFINKKKVPSDPTSFVDDESYLTILIKSLDNK